MIVLVRASLAYLKASSWSLSQARVLGFFLCRIAARGWRLCWAGNGGNMLPYPRIPEAF